VGKGTPAVLAVDGRVKFFVFVLFVDADDEEVQEEGKIFVREEGASVVDERGGCRAGAKPIVTKIAGFATVLGKLLEMCVERPEELEKGKAGKCDREGVVLGEAFFLLDPTPINNRRDILESTCLTHRHPFNTDNGHCERRFVLT
jgi:hypothetical protein